MADSANFPPNSGKTWRFGLGNYSAGLKNTIKHLCGMIQSAWLYRMLANIEIVDC